MKMIAFAAVLTAAFAGGARGAEIIGSSFTTGNWEGAAYTFDDTGLFSHCAVSVEYVSGDLLVFSVNSDVTVTVGVVSDRFNFSPGEEFPVSLHIDRRRPFEAWASAVDYDFLSFTIEDFHTAMDALTRGQSLTVRSYSELGSYDLTGSYRALEGARSCAIQQLEFEAQGRIPKTYPPTPAPGAAMPAPKATPTPVPTPAPAPDPGPGLLADRTVLFQIATEMIAATGARQFRYLDASESREIGGQDSVFWISDDAGIMGGVAILPFAGASLRETDAGDISFVSADCAGDVATSARTVPLDGLEAREVRGLCVDATGQVETLLTKVRVEDAVIYTLLAFGDGAAAATSRDRQELSKDVALRAASYVQD